MHLTSSFEVAVNVMWHVQTASNFFAGGSKVTGCKTAEAG